VDLDAKAIRDGLTTAQTVGAFMTSLGLIEGVKWAFGLWMERRAKKKQAAADAAKREAENQAAEHQQARDMRKDALAEAWQVAEERLPRAAGRHAGRG
jgi:Flp pilus assembly protein TadB